MPGSILVAYRDRSIQKGIQIRKEKNLGRHPFSILGAPV